MKLIIVDFIIETVARIHGHCRAIARHDPDLARQLKRSSSSIAQNAAEGLYARRGNRTARLDTAIQSGRESIVSIRLAGAARYLAQDIVAPEVDALDRVVGTLINLANRPR